MLIPRTAIALLALLVAASAARAGTAPGDGCSYAASLAAGFVETNPTTSQRITQPAGTALEVDSRITRFRSGDPDVHGEVVIARDSDDSVKSVIRQSGEQAHLRLSFGKDTSGNGRPQHMLIGPYNYGAAVEYPGVIEFWVAQFSVHNNHASTMKKEGAWFWVGDQIDAGGLFATSYYHPDLSKAYSVIASDMFSHTSHGSLHFQLRDPIDAYRFQWGPFNAEKTYAQIARTASSSWLGLESGTVSGYLEANEASRSLRLGSTGGVPIDFLAGGSSPTFSARPDGGLAVAGSGGYVAIGAAPASTGALRLCAGCGVGFRSPSGGDVEGIGSAPGATLVHDRRYVATDAALLPAEDAVRDLGIETNRWANVWAVQVHSSGAQVPGLNMVPSVPNPVFDAARGNTQKIVLSTDVTLSTLVNAAPGQPLNFIICQDDTGKHKFVWPDNVAGAMNIGPQAGRCSAQSFVFDGSRALATSSGMANQ